MKIMKLKDRKSVFMWQLEAQIFVSSYIWLAFIFEASYSAVVTSVSEKSSVDPSELEKQVLSHCWHTVCKAETF